MSTVLFQDVDRINRPLSVRLLERLWALTEAVLHRIGAEQPDGRSDLSVAANTLEMLSQVQTRSHAVDIFAEDAWADRPI